jgi:hypothetical protein
MQAKAFFPMFQMFYHSAWDARHSSTTRRKMIIASVNKYSSTQAKHSRSISSYSAYRSFPSGRAEEVPSPRMSPCSDAAAATSLPLRGEGNWSQMKNPPFGRSSLSSAVDREGRVTPIGARYCLIADVKLENRLAYAGARVLWICSVIDPFWSMWLINVETS